MKFIKKKLYIFIIALILISIIIGLKLYANATATVASQETTMTRMVAALSKAKDTNNELNTTIMQQELDKYAGSGSSTAEEDSDITTITYEKTGNEYVINDNLEYTITYDANGGTGTLESQTKKFGHRVKTHNTGVTRSGYIFLGWSTDSTATTAEYKPGSHYIANESATLYAVWQANSINILGEDASYNGEFVMYSAGYCHNSATFTNNGTSVTMSCQTSYTDNAGVVTTFGTVPIDLTNVTTISFTFSDALKTNSLGTYWFGVTAYNLNDSMNETSFDNSHTQKAGANARRPILAAEVEVLANISSGTYLVDVTSLSGEYYISATTYSHYNSGEPKNGITLNDITLNYSESYEQLEYIQTTGTQYIDTNITVFNQSNFEIDFIAAFTEVNYNYNNMWGTTDGYEYAQGWVNSSGAVMYKWGDARLNSGTTDTSTHTYKFVKNGSALTTYIDSTQTKTGSDSSTNSKKLRLFSKDLSSFGKAKVYGIQIFVDNVLTYNLVPTKRIRDGAIGLKDTINKGFYTNFGNGSGTFEVGSVVGTIEQ